MPTKKATKQATKQATKAPAKKPTKKAKVAAPVLTAQDERSPCPTTWHRCCSELAAQRKVEHG